MKNIILLILIISTAHASNLGKYVCQEYDRNTEEILSRTIVLEQKWNTTSRTEVIDDYEFEVADYYLTIYNGLDYFDQVTFEGKVFTEDIYFGFVSNDGKAKFSVYLDEMEEASLGIEEESTSYFVCR